MKLQLVSSLCSILLVALAQVQVASGAIMVEIEQKRLDDAREQFERRIKDRCYEFKYQRSCFCMEEYVQDMRIKVNEDKKIVSVTSLTDGAPVSESVAASVYTVEQIFDRIQDALNWNEESSALGVDYVPGYGYPEYLNIDYSAMIADEEFVVSVWDMKKTKCDEM